MKLLNAFIILIISHSTLYASQKPNQSNLAMLFKKLFFDPDCKNSIIIYGITTSQNTDLDPNHNLFALARSGIIANKKEIQEKDLKIAVFSTYEPRIKILWTAILKREGQAEYCRLYGTENPNQAKYIIYNIASYGQQESFYHVYNKLSNTTEIACLLLVDNTLLQQQHNVHNEIHEHFKGKKKIIMCDPYTGTIENDYKPSDRSLCRFMKYIYLFAIGGLLFTHYYAPETGTHILDAVKYMSTT